MSKVILITGASSGIGYDATLRLLKKGYTVYAAARNVERMEDLQRAGAYLINMDVTDDTSIKAGIEKILNQQNHIDVLVNNAGYGSFGAIENVALEEARRQFEVNVFGLARLIQLVLPIMRERKEGRIINISSMAGRFSEPYGGWYHATKYSVEALSDSLRMELKSFGIKVVLIEPGCIASNWSGIAMKHLVESSEGTVYESSCKNQADAFTMMYKRASDASIIGRTIEKAIITKNPKTRYIKGFGAKPIIFLSQIIPTKWMDSIMIKALFSKK